MEGKKEEDKIRRQKRGVVESGGIQSWLVSAHRSFSKTFVWIAEPWGGGSPQLGLQPSDNHL